MRNFDACFLVGLPKLLNKQFNSLWFEVMVLMYRRCNVIFICSSFEIYVRIGVAKYWKRQATICWVSISFKIFHALNYNWNITTLHFFMLILMAGLLYNYVASLRFAYFTDYQVKQPIIYSLEYMYLIRQHIIHHMHIEPLPTIMQRFMSTTKCLLPK